MPENVKVFVCLTKYGLSGGITPYKYKWGSGELYGAGGQKLSLDVADFIFGTDKICIGVYGIFSEREINVFGREIPAD